MIYKVVTWIGKRKYEAYFIGVKKALIYAEKEADNLKYSIQGGKVYIALHRMVERADGVLESIECIKVW